MAIKYVHVSYDFIDHENELMLVMEKSKGEADEENARFVYDGFAEAMLVRNSGQIVHFPVIVQVVGDLLKKIKIILVTEMNGDDIHDVYEAPVEVLNDSLPVPKSVYEKL